MAGQWKCNFSDGFSPYFWRQKNRSETEEEGETRHLASLSITATSFNETLELMRLKLLLFPTFATKASIQFKKFNATTKLTKYEKHFYINV